MVDGVEPFDGSQAPVPDATQLPSIPSTASIQSDPIDDMAAVVIVPRHGEENAIPEMPGLSFWLSTDGPVFTKPLAIASDKTGSVGSFLAQTPGSSSAFSPARRTEDIPSRPKAAAPDRLGLISNPPRDADGGLFPSPSPDDIPILDPVLTALCASPMGTAIRNGVDTAPLPEPHLACVVAMAKPVDVAVAAVTPHRTPIRGPGGVDVMAVTPSTGARSFPAGKDLTQVSLDDGNESSKLILGGPVPKLLQSVPQHTSPEPQAMTQPLPPVLLAPPLRGRTPPPLQVYSRRRSSRRAATMEGEAVASTSPSQPLSPATAFILKMAKTPNGLLPIPHISKRRKKPPPSEAPRRSRRIAGLGVDQPKACPTHLMKRVMRALDLDVDDEKGQLDQQLLEDYAQRFRQHVTPSHTRALAALFGWAPTEEDFVVGPVECVV